MTCQAPQAGAPRGFFLIFCYFYPYIGSRTLIDVNHSTPALANDMKAWFKVLRTLKNVEKNVVRGNTLTGNGFAGLILAQASFENEVIENTATTNDGTIPAELKPWSRGAGIYLSCGPSPDA